MLDDPLAIFRGLRGIKRSTRARLAREPRTLAFVDAALRLIDKQFSELPAQNDEESGRYPFFRWLSRPQIANEVVDPDGTVDEYIRVEEAERQRRQLEYLWPEHDRFIQDLLRYALTMRHWSLQLSMSTDTKNVLMESLRSGDFVVGVKAIAFEDLLIPLEDPTALRLELLAAVLAQREPEIQQVLAENYANVDSSWTDLYKSIFETRGWKLRPGITYQDLNLILATAAEGMALRCLIDTAGIIDEEKKTSLLGTLALALVISVVDPGDGRSMESEVSEMVRAAGGSQDEGS